MLNKDIVSVLQEVDTYLVGCNYYESDNEDDWTPAIAVYQSKLFGGTKLKEIQYNKNGDGTVMGVSSAAVDSSGNAILPYKNFKNTDHTALVSDASVLSYVCNTINGVSAYALDENLMVASTSSDTGMSSMIKVIVSADKEFSVTVYDVNGEVVAESTDTDYYGWDGGKFKLNILSYEEDDYSLQLYMPNTGYKVDFSYGTDAGAAINAELSVSSLDYDGNKTAIADSSDTVTGADGILFTLDMISSVASSDTLETIVTNASDTPAQKAVYDTNWDISTSVKLDNIGDSSTITLTGDSTAAGNLSWFSSDDSIVTVDENGTVTAMGYGVATVTAVQEGSLKAENCIVTVKLNAASVQFADIEMIIGEKVKISPVFDSDSVTETEIEYLTSESGIISIDEYGVITALAAGTVTVTGTAPGGATNTFTVDVGTSSVIAVESISLSKTSVEVRVGGTTTIEATIEPADAANTDILWFVDDETIATIDYTGKSCKISGVSAGTTRVTAVTQDGGYTASCEVKVNSSGGGGGTVTPSNPSYQITVSTTTNGTATVTPTSAKSGAKVTITATPDEGYTVDSVTVTNSSGNSISVTDNGNGTYTFTMPASKVTVNVTFVPAQEDPSEEPWVNPFTDVSESDWFYDEVAYVVQNGLMVGVGNQKFNPGGTTSRAMIVTILYRLEGEPAVSQSTFTDVEAGQWYTNAVAWAAENNIVKGYGNNTFGPNDDISREQMATILYRYADYKGYDVSRLADLSSYTDTETIGSWALTAMRWANSEGLITGRTTTTLVPKGNAIRAEAAAILMRFCQNVAGLE